MRITILALTLLALGLSTSSARADGGLFGQQPYYGPFANHNPNPFMRHFFTFRGGQTLPVFQAAPWYLYWPYDGHFMTAAPIQGAYSPPPASNNYMYQPYFPQPSMQNVPPPQNQNPTSLPPAFTPGVTLPNP